MFGSLKHWTHSSSLPSLKHERLREWLCCSLPSDIFSVTLMRIIGLTWEDVKDFQADTSRAMQFQHTCSVTTGKRYQCREKGIAVWAQVTGKGPLHPNTAVEVAVSCFKALFCLFRTQRYWSPCVLGILSSRMWDVKTSCWFSVRSLMCGSASC